MAPLLEDTEQALLMKYNIVPVDKSLYMPDAVPPNNVNHDNSVNLNYDSLITINGNVNDTHQFISDMSKMIQKTINENVYRFKLERRYG